MYNVDFLVRSFHTTHNVEHGTSLLVRLLVSQALKKWSEDLKVQRRIADDDKRAMSGWSRVSGHSGSCVMRDTA